MKTQSIELTRNNQFNNYTQNQKVMKSKKYSKSMKSVVLLAVLLLISVVTFAQTIEERKGGTSTYSVAAGVATDEYTWTIEAPVVPASVIPAPSSGTGVTGDPYVITWTADLTSIQVTWAADATPNITSTTGAVTVQKRINAGATCPSPVQNMGITLWSAPAAAIDPGETDLDVCSTDPVTGTITLNLAGAPDAGQSGTDGFEVIYDVAVSDPALTVTGPNGAVGTGQSVTSDGATVTIPLPDALVNTDAAAQTYTITLSTVQDDFNNPAVAIVGEVYTITVYPTPTTGIISSDGALTRR